MKLLYIYYLSSSAYKLKGRFFLTLTYLWSKRNRVVQSERLHGANFDFVTVVGHGNGFVTTEPKFVYLKSPGVKFMNYFTDLKNPLLKSFGSYKVEWVKW